MIKRLVALSLVLIFSIESLAAVVSDNDGSAFITKAEFDSLKNDFQSQIDQYNTSIDSKIDGAIASYLAGIKTVKRKELEIPVSNYYNMVWMRKPMIYGSYATWNSTAAGTMTSNTWYQPFFDIWKSFRRSQNNLLFNGGRFGMQHAYTLIYDIDWTQSGCSIIQAGDNGNKVHPQAYVLQCSPDEIMGKNCLMSDFWSSTGTMFERKATSYRQENVENYQGSTWQPMESSTGASQAQAPILNTNNNHIWLEDMGATGNQFINVRIVVNRNNKRAGADAYMRWICSRNINEVNYMFAHYQTHDWKSDYSSSGISNISNATPGVWTKNPTGIHWMLVDNSTFDDQKDTWWNLMLGDDTTYTVNIERVDSNVIVGGDENYFVKSDYSESFASKMIFRSLYCHADNPWTYDTTIGVDYSTTSKSKNINLKLKYPERFELKRIAHSQFKNKDIPVSLGEGLQLANDLEESGFLTIEFDYDVDIAVGTLSSSDTGIKVDIKKSDFLSSSNDYINGIRNDETAPIQLKNAFFDTTNKHAKIVIESDQLRKYDDVYMRIAPKSTRDGLRAHISNLKMVLDIE